MPALAGYLLMIASLATFLQARRGLERDALIDGSIVCVGATVAATVLFVLPAVAIPDRSVLGSLLAVTFPLLDTVLVLLVVNLAFTTVTRQPSFYLLLAMMVLLFTGDIGYAIVNASGGDVGSALLDLPFLLAFTLGGAAALHPSARDLVQATPRPGAGLVACRGLLIILPAVAMPFVLTVALIRDRSALDDAVLAIGGAVDRGAC